MRDGRLRELALKLWSDSNFGKSLSSLMGLGLQTSSLLNSSVSGDLTQMIRLDGSIEKRLWRMKRNWCYIALNTTVTRKKVELLLIEDTVGISTLRAMVFHFNLQALHYFSSLGNSQQLVNHLFWYACLCVCWELQRGKDKRLFWSVEEKII